MTFPTTSVLDNFNRTNANPLDGSWANGFYGDGNFKVLSNQLDKAVAGWTGARYTAAQYGADCEVYVDVVTVGTELQLYLRVGGTHTSPSGYYFKWYSGTNQCGIYKVTDGTATLIGSAFTCALSNGDKLGLSAVGSTLSAWKYTSGAWGASPVHSETDSTYSAAGYLAIEANGGFVCDNFGGGTIPAAGTAVPVFLHQLQQQGIA